MAMRTNSVAARVRQRRLPARAVNADGKSARRTPIVGATLMSTEARRILCRIRPRLACRHPLSPSYSAVSSAAHGGCVAHTGVVALSGD